MQISFRPELFAVVDILPDAYLNLFRSCICTILTKTIGSVCVGGGKWFTFFTKFGDRCEPVHKVNLVHFLPENGPKIGSKVNQTVKIF